MLCRFSFQSVRHLLEKEQLKKLAYMKNETGESVETSLDTFNRGFDVLSAY